MDNYTLNDLEKYFEVRKEEAGLLFIFLTLLSPGSSISFFNGQIEKLTEDTFRLVIDKDTYNRVADDFLVEGIEDYNEIFENTSRDADDDGEESDDG